ncbi:CmpA/NrtA family ABC transporter substrate-binding protein [Telmatospirillum sp. J64-1]|uniref:CmpA/NrtA family ABC transporter substrate-binding protein n=1 Tax=Telmatospirillum sp. J64-1 TaxID=2502183 RepID=UPI00115C99E6|nr:CmpA/NrtA family ABC transporter substrate-binding protein [Telmatospirillum sp. J64-1]
MSLEKTRLRLGIVPLIDAAPLVAAKERGFFAMQGLEVEISREASWANIRDKVALGVLDGAHMLATMPLSASLGLGAIREKMVAAMGLNTGGNAITLSNALWERMAEADPAAMTRRPVTARALKTVIEEDRRQGRPPMTFAVVYPVSPHMLELRYWMASAGIDTERDLRLVVVPPPQMVAQLSAGNIDGYCVGEPWNSLAVSLGLGRVAITSRELWAGRVEKVFGVTESWARTHPQTHKAVLKALIQAACWCDENRGELAEILAQPAYVNAPAEVVRASLLGRFRYEFGGPEEDIPDFLLFHRHGANFPWRSQALWFLRQMARWRQLPPGVDMGRTMEEAYRPDLYRMAALELGLAVPTTDSKTEGTHAGLWTLTQASAPLEMGPDLFFDGSVFDPAAASQTSLPPGEEAAGA